jgi:hypothetical protein
MEGTVGERVIVQRPLGEVLGFKVPSLSMF